MPSYWIRPKTDDKADWTEVPVGTAWSLLNEPVVPPAAVSTASNYIESAAASQLSRHKLTVPTLAANEIPQMYRWWAYLAVPTGGSLSIQGGDITHTVNGLFAAAWSTSPWLRVTDQTQAWLDGMTVQANNVNAVATTRVYAIAGELVTAIRTVSVYTGSAWAIKPHLTNIGGSWVEKVPVKRP